jgi:hypothetical protein
MMNHDNISSDKSSITTNANLNKSLSFKEEFTALGIDDVVEKSKDPMFLSMLLFKLLEERQKSNKLVEELNRKYDEIMFKLKTQPSVPQADELARKEFNILPEQDQMIIGLIQERGRVEANEVQRLLNYKGQNGAAQRLNKLVKEGHLKKVRAGRKMFFIEAHNINSLPTG